MLRQPASLSDSELGTASNLSNMRVVKPLTRKTVTLRLASEQWQIRVPVPAKFEQVPLFNPRG